LQGQQIKKYTEERDICLIYVGIENPQKNVASFPLLSKVAFSNPHTKVIASVSHLFSLCCY